MSAGGRACGVKMSMKAGQAAKYRNRSISSLHLPNDADSTDA
jgi:hypothetical protein